MPLFFLFIQAAVPPAAYLSPFIEMHERKAGGKQWIQITGKIVRCCLRTAGAGQSVVRCLFLQLIVNQPDRPTISPFASLTI